MPVRSRTRPISKRTFEIKPRITQICSAAKRPVITTAAGPAFGHVLVVAAAVRARLLELVGGVVPQPAHPLVLPLVLVVAAGVAERAVHPRVLGRVLGAARRAAEGVVLPPA